MKIFISDVDDTIYSHKTYNIHPYTKQMLKELVDKDIPIVLASARVLKGLDSMMDELKLSGNNAYVIASNGSEIYNYHDREYLWEATFTDELISEVYQISKELELNMGIEQKDYLQCTTLDEAFDEDRKVLPIDIYVPGGDFLKAIKYPTHKLSLTGNKEKIASSFEIVEKLLDKKCSVSRAGFNYIDIVPLGVTKAFAIRKLLDMLNLDHLKIYYIGDSYNDLPSFEIADVSAAVGNANKAVLAKADVIVGNCEDGGVGEFIAKVILDAQ